MVVDSLLRDVDREWNGRRLCNWFVPPPRGLGDAQILEMRIGVQSRKVGAFPWSGDLMRGDPFKWMPMDHSLADVLTREATRACSPHLLQQFGGATVEFALVEIDLRLQTGSTRSARKRSARQMKEIANLYHKDVVCETDGATTHLVMVANLFGRGSVHFAKLRNMKLAGTSVSTSAGKFYAFFDGVRGKALTEFFHCPINTTNVGTDRMVAVARFAVFVQPSQHPPPSLPPSPPDSDAEDDEQEPPPPPPPPPPHGGEGGEASGEAPLAPPPPWYPAQPSRPGKRLNQAEHDKLVRATDGPAGPGRILELNPGIEWRSRDPETGQALNGMYLYWKQSRAVPAEPETSGAEGGEGAGEAEASAEGGEAGGGGGGEGGEADGMEEDEEEEFDRVDADEEMEGEGEGDEMEEDGEGGDVAAAAEEGTARDEEEGWKVAGKAKKSKKQKGKKAAGGSTESNVTAAAPSILKTPAGGARSSSKKKAKSTGGTSR